MKQRLILHVDDDIDDRELLSAIINNKDETIKVVEAANGREALHYLRDAKSKGDDFPCLIVLDINMPVLDGRETFRHLQADSELKQLENIAVDLIGYCN